MWWAYSLFSGSRTFKNLWCILEPVPVCRPTQDLLLSDHFSFPRRLEDRSSWPLSFQWVLRFFNQSAIRQQNLGKRFGRRKVQVDLLITSRCTFSALLIVGSGNQATTKKRKVGNTLVLCRIFLWFGAWILSTVARRNCGVHRCSSSRMLLTGHGIKYTRMLRLL